MKWDGHVAHMEEIRDAYISVGNVDRKDNFGDTDIDEKIILK
jgi:hypothetical protein